MTCFFGATSRSSGLFFLEWGSSAMEESPLGLDPAGWEEGSEGGRGRERGRRTNAALVLLGMGGGQEREGAAGVL